MDPALHAAQLLQETPPGLERRGPGRKEIVQLSLCQPLLEAERSQTAQQRQSSHVISGPLIFLQFSLRPSKRKQVSFSKIIILLRTIYHMGSPYDQGPTNSESYTRPFYKFVPKTVDQ